MDHVSVHCAMRSGEIAGQGQVLPPRRPHTQVLRQMRFRQKVVISGDHRERFEGDAKVGVVNELIGKFDEHPGNPPVLLHGKDLPIHRHTHPRESRQPEDTALWAL